MTGLALTGLRTRPSQVWGGIRLVPLVRDEPIEDLRLHPRVYDAYGIVDVGRRTTYASYIPHGFVASWTDDGTPAAAYGTRLTSDAAPPPRVPVRVHRRMARRVEPNRLRFLPLHLAMEGYLALHFRGPAVAWEQWSAEALRRGLSPRAEEAYRGAAIHGLEDALRIFEIHPGQCGVLVYAADALAAAFVVPHPADYRVLHPTVVQDLFGELIHHYALLSGPVPDFAARLDDPSIKSLGDLRAAALGQVDGWAGFHDDVMARGLLDDSYTYENVHGLARFSLSRFLPSFTRRRENHIGEMITADGDGALAYLKTFRLSEAQTRRGHLLASLSAHDWHLGRTAEALALTEVQLALRVVAAGFGAMMRQDVLDGYLSAARRG
ncbi:hypothetical protein EDD29_2077 [Actinocorallia herbida]|uniref:ARG and Rhodanese-Phosphatase-superfamily-associated domain-containing protein n=1 Tax=Actinocorallia herbida TaxID=58109 RepID=A0A3N1CTC2_9ACTN|nr:hypothetical protein [Actinocorallia herbida]ROO84550.1 hypothetical protein EDD29_2077 [Actinocorallia herbida]